MTLSEDIAEQIVVKAGDVVLDSNGHNINVEGNDAIVVDPGASLIIEGQGTVLTSGSHNYASLYNRGGSVVINGGTFLEDEDATYYAILNHGEMTINNGVKVEMKANAGGDFKANLIDSGYSTFATSSDERTGYVEGVGYEYPTMTINGGTFNTSAGNDKTSVYVGGHGVDSVDDGMLTINGGAFNAEYLIETDGTHEPAEIKIKNGTFNVQEIVNPGEDHAPGNIIHVTEISGGVYANKDIELSEYLSNKSDLKKYILSDGSVLLAQSVVFDSSKSTINLVVDGDTASLDLPELVLQYGDIKNYPGEDGGAVELKGNKVVAMKLGTAKITVTFDGRTK